MWWLLLVQRRKEQLVNLNCRHPFWLFLPRYKLVLSPAVMLLVEPSVLVVLAGFGCLVVQLHDAHAPDEGVHTHTHTHESNYSSTRLPACPAGVSLSWAWMAACSCDLTFNSDYVQTGSFKHPSSFFETVVCHNTLDSGSTC